MKKKTKERFVWIVIGALICLITGLGLYIARVAEPGVFPPLPWYWDNLWIVTFLLLYAIIRLDRWDKKWPRFYVPAFLAGIGAMVLHRSYENDPLVWLYSTPVALAGSLGGWIWQQRHDKQNAEKLRQVYPDKFQDIAINREDLETILRTRQADPLDYCLKGGLPDGKYTLEKAEGKWSVYYSWREQRSDVNVFDTEDEACRYMLNQIPTGVSDVETYHRLAPSSPGIKALAAIVVILTILPAIFEILPATFTLLSK